MLLAATGGGIGAGGRAARSARDLRQRLHGRVPAWLVVLLFGLVVLLLGVWSVRLTPDGSDVALWWPAAGVAVGVMVRRWDLRWALLASLIGAGFLANLIGGRSWELSAGFAVANALEAVVTASCLVWLIGDRPDVSTLGDAWKLLGAALAGGVAIGVGAAVTVQLFGDGPLGATLLNVVFSHVASVLIIVPLLLASPSPRRRRSVEVVASWTFTGTSTAIVFAPGQWRPLAFVVMGSLIWPALRFGVRATCAQLVAVSVAASLLTVAGDGPFAATASGPSLAALVQAFMITCAGMAISLAIVTTERERALDRERTSGALMRLGFEEALVGMLLIDLDGQTVQVIEANPAATSMLGLREGDVVHDLWDDEDQPFGALLSRLEPGRGWRGEMVFSPREGAPKRYAIAASRLTGTGRHRLASCQIVDVTDRHRAELELERAALHDPLTALPNRELLQRQLADLLESEEDLAVMLVDLDDFKLVNDTAGHQVGDRVLVEVGRRLTRCVNPGDTVARLGGDEFVVICRGVGDRDAAMGIARRIWESLDHRVAVGSTSYNVDLSIGIALRSADVTAQRLLSRADIALYSAKGAGKRQAALYSTALGAAAADRVRLEDELRAALDGGQLRVHLQPVVDLRDGRWVAAEALLRWEHPERGLLLPGAFLPIAEGAGMMDEIGAWALDESCRSACEWIDLVGPAAAPIVHVNVSARQIDRPGLHATVTSALHRHALPASKLVLELTETYLAEMNPEVMVELHALVEAGVEIAADDYGTGYSPLTRVTEMPIHIIKIDQRFVRAAITDTRAHAVVASLNDLARRIGLKVIAEGVEDAHTAETMRQIGIRQAQGFLWQPGLTPGRFAELLPAATRVNAPSSPAVR
jgi:diguanylate cyclase (GGDEF)-like protein/PAS domain S-box-containing protein